MRTTLLSLARRAVYAVVSRWQARRGARIVADLGPQRAITATPATDTRWSTLSRAGQR